jgi:hypothetical protein
MNKERLEWLLETDQPSIRYYTLIDLLDKDKLDSEVQGAYDDISRHGWAKEILRLQDAKGFWESENSLYRPKYVATVWRLIVLSDLGLTKKQRGVRKACELILENYPRPDGGFGREKGHF